MKQFVSPVAAALWAVPCGLYFATVAAAESMEHVLVTAPLHKTEAETALPVTVLDGEQLRNVVSANLGETLAFQPGLNSTSYGTGVGKPVIRGQTGPRVLVLQNGLAAQDVSTLSPDHANATEPFLAERIEVIKGPAALLYGNGAIGGVVNVIDGRIPDAAVEGAESGLAYRHNTVDDGNTALARLDLGMGSLALHLDGLYSENNNVSIPGAAITGAGAVAPINSRGYIGNSDGRNSSMTAGASWIQTWGYVGASINQLDKNYGIPPGVHAGHEHAEDAVDAHELAAAGIRIDMEQRRIDMKSEVYHPFAWLEVGRLQVANTRYSHAELEGGHTGTTYDNDAWNLRMELVHHALAGWHGAFGLDAASRDFAALGDEVFVPESTTRNLGVFLLEDRHFDAWTLELGLRAEYQQLEPDDHSLQGQNSTSWTLSAATIWSADDYNTITMAISSSQRPPVAEELYANVGNIDSGLFVEHGATGAVEIGDPDLGKETSTNIELGWTHTGAAWDASVNLFYNYFGDYIYLGNTGLLYNLQECPGTSICDPQEVDEGAPVHIYAQQAALFRGLEAQIDIPLWPRGPYEMSLELFGDYVRATLEDSGDDVPRMPPARIGARFNYQAGPWSGFVGFLHGFEQNHAGANETATAAYTRLDLGAYYQLSAADCQWLLFVKANNLSNAEIRNSTSYLRNFAPEPGRGFELGVSLEF